MQRRTKKNETAKPAFDNDYEPIDYDTMPAERISAFVQQEASEVSYIPNRGKVSKVSPVSRTTDVDFHTSQTNRKGLGGRGTIGKYGVQYLSLCRRNYAPITLEVMQRRYIRIDKDVEYLNRLGKMSTQSPQKMTVVDIANYLIYRQSLEVSNSDILHDIAALKGAFSIIGSNVVDEALAQYPYLRPTGKNPRLPSMDKRAFDRIFENSALVEDCDWRRMRAYAVVIFALSTGMRAKELRLCDLKDIRFNAEGWTAEVRHPKGEGKYGKIRVTWIDPIAYTFLDRYFKARENFVGERNIFTDVLFPGPNGENLAGNTIRTDKALVEEELGYGFDLRMCRRTFGQRLIDRGISVEVVSKLLGHESVTMTEGSYCSMEGKAAIDAVIKTIPAKPSTPFIDPSEDVVKGENTSVGFATGFGGE